MLKIIRFIFFSFLALCLIAGAGIFIFFETFDTDQYLPRVTQKASLALGRPVSIGHLGLGFSLRGITLDAAPVIIADDAGFTTLPFIKIDRVRINLDLKSLILRREIHITGILLQSPQIHIIRSQEGYLNVSNMGSPHTVVRTGGDNIAVSTAEVKSIENTLPNSTSPNDTVNKEHVLPDINIKSIKIQDAAISFIDQNEACLLDLWLTNINASLDDFSLSKPFQLLFEASLYNDAPNVHGKALVSLDPATRSIHISGLELDADLSRLNAEEFKGISPEFSDNPVFKNIKGIVQLHMAHLDIEPSRELTVNGDMVFTGGVIKDFNIIRTVLSHTLGAFGGMDGIIDNLLNGQLKSKLGAADTVIEKAQVQFSFHDKTLFIDDSLIKTDIFELTAKGSVDQGLNMDMETALHLNEDVSTALVNQLDGLKFLMDDSKRIAIDASLKGVVPHLKYKPNKDFRKKSKKFLMQEGGNILGILLGGGQAVQQGQDSPEPEQGKKSKNSFKNIFKNFLQ